jgi:hypothetical protein
MHPEVAIPDRGVKNVHGGLGDCTLAEDMNLDMVKRSIVNSDI